MVSSLIVAIPAIGREFSMSASGGELDVDSFLPCSFYVSFCHLGERQTYSSEKIFTAGIYVHFIFALLTSLITSSMILTTARFMT